MEEENANSSVQRREGKREEEEKGDLHCHGLPRCYPAILHLSYILVGVCQARHTRWILAFLFYCGI